MRLLHLAAPLLAAALALPARAADLNVISDVSVREEGTTVVLSVKGTKKPSFTTFSMAEPPRFVIDFSESRFEGVPETLQVGDGTINVVKNLSYGSDATSIARVMIAFAAEVPAPDVTDVGETLVVRITKAAEAAPVAAAPAAAPKDDPVAAKADAEAKPRAEADAAAQADAEQQARADVEAKRQAAEAQAAEARAREEQQRADAEASKLAAASAREAEQAAAAKAAAAGAERVARDAAAREEREAEAEVEAAPVVAAPAPEAERLEVGAPAARLREVGFKQLAGASRVYVRTSVTPRFTIRELGEGVVRLELENTRVERRNDLRFLDTSFFASAVTMVTPGREGSSYVVDIKLREKVPYQQRIEGDLLAIDFERPASSAAAAAPAAPAVAEEPPLPAAEETPALEVEPAAR